MKDLYKIELYHIANWPAIGDLIRLKVSNSLEDFEELLPDAIISQAQTSISQRIKNNRIKFVCDGKKYELVLLLCKTVEEMIQEKKLKEKEIEELAKIHYTREEALSIFYSAFNILTEREKFVLNRRYLDVKNSKPMTYEKIGEELGRSRERVRQISLRAEHKFKLELWHECAHREGGAPANHRAFMHALLNQ